MKENETKIIGKLNIKFDIKTKFVNYENYVA